VAAILFVQPLLQRGEIFHERIAVDAILTGHGFQRFRPGAALPQFQHGFQLLACLLVIVNGALVQRARIASGAAEAPMKLELQSPRQEID
jgi:hypothetical protein